MERFKEIIHRLLELCAVHENIKVIIVIGSQCRTYKKADEYSDLDLIIACDKPEKFLYKNKLLNEVCINGTDFDVWHNGRMLEQWTDDDIIQELRPCFAHYDADDIKKALKQPHCLQDYQRCVRKNMDIYQVSVLLIANR